MAYIALKRFLFGSGHIERGAVVPIIPGRDYNKLKELGFIMLSRESVGSAAPVTATVEAVAIPDDWRELPWVPKKKGGDSLRVLADRVSAQKITKKAEAIEAIEAELERRSANSGPIDETPDEAGDPVAIPDDWRELDEAERIALAAHFSGDMEIAGVEDADAVIELEIERRKEVTDGEPA